MSHKMTYFFLFTSIRVYHFPVQIYYFIVMLTDRSVEPGHIPIADQYGANTPLLILPSYPKLWVRYVKLHRVSGEELEKLFTN